MIPAIFYRGVFLTCILMLCLKESFRIFPFSSNTLLRAKRKGWETAILLSIFLVVFIGTRPIDVVFVDTVGYAAEYMKPFNTEINKNQNEWIWIYFENFCKDLGLSVHAWFTGIAFFYIAPMLLACKRWFSNQNIYLAMLFLFSALAFFPYGVNGLRNGVACSFVILAMSIYSGKLKDMVISGLLCFCGYFIHKSVALPIACFLVSYYIIKNFQWALMFWLFSIILSLTFGTSIAFFLEPILGFDQRFSAYLSAGLDPETMKGFSQTGFRWDFLLYSCMPILLGYYILQRRKMQDRIYNILINTYVLANAFWIIVINAAFSNRFAYLSWFMYPVVLVYPLLKLPIWKDQGRKVAYILMFHCAFTYFMWLIR